jgi:hypothetical protein
MEIRKKPAMRREKENFVNKTFKSLVFDQNLFEGDLEL